MSGIKSSSGSWEQCRAVPKLMAKTGDSEFTNTQISNSEMLMISLQYLVAQRHIRTHHRGIYYMSKISVYANILPSTLSLVIGSLLAAIFL